MLSPIIDGFLYNTNYRMLYGYYPTAALQAIDSIRRANNYQPRYFVVPEDLNAQVPAFGVHEYQVSCKSGSIVWGYSFFSSSGLFSFNIFDANTGRLGSDNIIGSGTSTALYEGPIIFPSPYVVPDPGLLAVEIGSLSSIASTPTTLQLVLFAIEPVCCEKDCTKL